MLVSQIAVEGGLVQSLVVLPELWRGSLLLSNGG